MERQSSELVSMPSLPEPRSPALYSLEDDEADGQEAAALLQDATSPPEGSGKPGDAKHRGDGDAVRPASDADSELSSEGQTRWRTGGRECIRYCQTRHDRMTAMSTALLRTETSQQVAAAVAFCLVRMVA